MHNKITKLTYPNRRSAAHLSIAAVIALALVPQGATAQTPAAKIDSSSSSGLSQIEQRLAKGGNIPIPAHGSTTAGGGVPIVDGGPDAGSNTPDQMQSAPVVDAAPAGATGSPLSKASYSPSPAADSANRFKVIQGDAALDVAFSGSRELFQDPKGKDMLASWDGWADAYEGYGRSPILFDPVDLSQAAQGNVPEYRTDLKRKYPELSYYQKDPDKRSMRLVNIGVDKEILKSTMAIYQHKADLQASNANDEFARDNYLNMFKSLLGVANLTLSYLDKTVAAGLATTRSQLDAGTTQDLLKQINWSSARMANPEMSRIYRDTDEKFEACLFLLQPNGARGQSSQTQAYLKQVQQTLQVCQQGGKCGKRPTATTGMFNYCICCAEESVDPNPSSVVSGGGAMGEDAKNQWSLVDRVWFGVAAPKPSTSKAATDDKDDYVRRVSQSFKELYGDVVLGKGRIDNKGTLVEKEKVFLRFEYPSLSPAQKISLIRNGVKEKADCQLGGGGLWPSSPGGGGWPSGGTIVCPIQDIVVTKGICPAIVELLQLYPNVTERNNKQLMDTWLQASLGKVITPKDLEDMLNMGGYQSYELPLGTSWQPRGSLYTYLQNFCDASAVSTFKRFHVRMKSLAYDHVTLNRNLADDEKRDFFALIDRVDKYVALAEQDVQAPEVARQMAIQLSIEAARLKEERQGAAMEATKNSTWINQVSSGIKGFGGR